jgi:ribonucleoside-diphosphate reductase alpha chain
MATMLKTVPATQLRLQMFRQPRCPDCGGPLAHGEGCETCPVCGYSHCGA